MRKLALLYRGYQKEIWDDETKTILGSSYQEGKGKQGLTKNSKSHLFLIY